MWRFLMLYFAYNRLIFPLNKQNNFNVPQFNSEQKISANLSNYGDGVSPLIVK